jgi:hypothetical protein
MFLVPLILFGEPDGDFRGHARFLVPAASTTPLRSAKVLCGESSSGTRLYPRGLSGAILGAGMSAAACTLAACEAVNRRRWGTASGCCAFISAITRCRTASMAATIICSAVFCIVLFIDLLVNSPGDFRLWTPRPNRGVPRRLLEVEVLH